MARADPGSGMAVDSGETSQARWFEPSTTTELPMHPLMRQRLTHALDPRANTRFD